jgi:hypothetical protein
VSASQVRARTVRTTPLLGGRGGLLGVAGGAECGFDAVGERVDELGELSDGVQRGVLLVVDSEGVDGLVDEGAQPRVGRDV